MVILFSSKTLNGCGLVQCTGKDEGVINYSLVQAWELKQKLCVLCVCNEFHEVHWSVYILFAVLNQVVKKGFNG